MPRKRATQQPGPAQEQADGTPRNGQHAGSPSSAAASGQQRQERVAPSAAASPAPGGAELQRVDGAAQQHEDSGTHHQEQQQQQRLRDSKALRSFRLRDVPDSVTDDEAERERERERLHARASGGVMKGQQGKGVSKAPGGTSTKQQQQQQLPPVQRRLQRRRKVLQFAAALMVVLVAGLWLGLDSLSEVREALGQMCWQQKRGHDKARHAWVGVLAAEAGLRCSLRSGSRQGGRWADMPGLGLQRACARTYMVALKLFATHWTCRSQHG